jgi:hypothetical protein
LLTPYELRLFLHLHAIAEPYENRETALYVDTVQRFIADGVIEPDDRPGSGYMTTHKGIAWLDAILATPQPVQKWVQP